MKTSKRCGSCAHTEPVAGDLTKVTCYGGPPQLVHALQQTPTGVAMVVVGSAYPQMDRTARACAVHSPDLIIDQPKTFDVVG